MKNVLCTTLLCGALLIWPAQHITEPAIANAATVTYQTTAKVNVRAGAGTSYKVLGKLKKGQSITVKKTVGAWHKISYNGKAGYVSASYVKFMKPAEKPTHMTTARVNVRAGASTNYKVTDKLVKGKFIVVKKTTGAWYKISYDGKTGYILKSYAKSIIETPETSFEGKYYATEQLNVRNGAGVGYKKIGHIPTGKRVYITKKVGEWYKITYEGISGYVTSAYVQKQTFKNQYDANKLYEVGVDMPSGEYKLYTENSGYLNVYKNNRNTLDFQQSITHFGYVTLQKGQFIRMQDAYAVPIAEAKPYNVVEHAGKYIDGTYKVGFDAPIGDYAITTTKTGMVAQYESINQAQMLDRTTVIENMTYTVDATASYVEFKNVTSEYVGDDDLQRDDAPKTLTLLADSMHQAAFKNSYTSYLQPGTYKMTLSWASSQSAGSVLVTDKHGNIQLDAQLTKHRALNVYTIQVDERTAITLSNFNATLIQP